VVCGNCHDAAVQGTTAPAVDHLDTNVDVYDSTAGDLGYPQNVAKGSGSWTTCSTASCHTNAQDDLGTTITQKTTANWGTAQGCDTCHDFNVSDEPSTGSHPNHITRTVGSCVECHDVYGNGTQPDLGSPVHINSILNIVPSGANKQYAGADVSFTYNGSDSSPGNHAPGQGYGTCSTVSCHGGGATRAWGASGNSCTDCHSNQGSGLSGAHAAHTTTPYVGTLSANDYGNYTTNNWYSWSNTAGSLDIGCGYCHPQSDANHADGTKDITLNNNETGSAGTVRALNGGSAGYTRDTTKVCSQVYCHSDGNNDLGAYGWNDSPEWTAGTITTCNVCHNNQPTTNAHGVHVVGIHYDTIYDLAGGGLLAVDATAGSAHGNSATSTTVNCQTCHNNTVTSSANSGNSVCSACHSDTNTPATGDDNAVISGDVHVDGTPDVAFEAVTLRSKAQLRDNITDVADVNTYWNRNTAYKSVAADHDNSKAALNPTASYSSPTCSTVACHNGNAVNWNSGAITCDKCHTATPK
jgi:predicted CxxxxCH...CXXCH cytochrome family protein